MSETPCHIPATAFMGWPVDDRPNTPLNQATDLLLGRTRAVAMYRSELAMARSDFARMIRIFRGSRTGSYQRAAFASLKLARQALAGAIQREAAARDALAGAAQ